MKHILLSTCALFLLSSCESLGISKSDAVGIAKSGAFVAIEVFEEELQEMGLEREKLKQELQSLHDQLISTQSNMPAAHELRAEIGRLKEELAESEHDAARMLREMKSQAAGEAVGAISQRLEEVATNVVQRRTKHISSSRSEEGGTSTWAWLGPLVMAGLNIGGALVSGRRV